MRRVIAANLSFVVAVIESRTTGVVECCATVSDCAGLDVLG